MMRINRKANVLIYSLVLVNLALLLSLAMFNNFSVFLNNTQRGNIEKKLSNNILYKGSLFAKYARTMNNNGSGIVDLIGCPSSVTMSGDTVISTTTSSLVFTGTEMYCSGMHSSQPYYIHFSGDYSGFSGATYLNDSINVEAGLGNRSFIDSDVTLIDFSAGLPTSPDGIDDNFNSDNYRVSASGATMFPGNYSDDDILPRVSIYGYISSQGEYENIFWSNDKVLDYIENNPGNYDSIYEQIGLVSSGAIYIDADQSFDLKLIQFNKTSYNTTKELIIENFIETTGIGAGIGYIQNNAGVLSLSEALTGNEYVFDFTANDYAIFLNNTGNGVLTYLMTGRNSSGSGIYINAINDSGPSSIKYLGAEIIQDSEKNYIGKILEVVNKK